MSELNVIKVDIAADGVIDGGTLSQWDKGQVLEFTTDVADGVEIEFANRLMSQTISCIVRNNKVEIPDELLESSYKIYAWLKVIDENSETTFKEIHFFVKRRTKPSDYVAAPHQQSFREYVEESLNKTKAIAQSVRDDADNHVFDYMLTADDKKEITNLVHEELADELPRIIEYVHQGNQEIYFSELDYETGIFTCAEQHGLDINDTLHMCILVYHEGLNVSFKTIPKELSFGDVLRFRVIDEYRIVFVKVATDITSIDDSNTFIDVKNFHIELPVRWSVRNIGEVFKARRIIFSITGFFAGYTRYFGIRDNNGVGGYSLPSAIKHSILYGRQEFDVALQRDGRILGEKYCALMTRHTTCDTDSENQKGIIRTPSYYNNGMYLGFHKDDAYINIVVGDPLYISNGTKVAISKSYDG